MSEQPSVAELVRALRAFREEWGIETLAASYMDERWISVKRDGSAWVRNPDGSSLRLDLGNLR